VKKTGKNACRFRVRARRCAAEKTPAPDAGQQSHGRIRQRNDLKAPGSGAAWRGKATKRQNFLQGLKFLLFSVPAGIISAAPVTLLNETIRWDYCRAISSR
jgi:hypothetical protein